MSIKKSKTVIILCVVSLLITNCGPGQFLGSTSTPTATPTPIATPTPTPIPGGVITGRVYLMDRDEPVHTTVWLYPEEGNQKENSTATDENGYYYFLVEDPDTYHIAVSVMDLLDTCDNLRTESGWLKTERIGSTGVVDIRARSFPPISISIGDEITLDCELFCD